MCMDKRYPILIAAFLLTPAFPLQATEDETGRALEAIKRVAREGKGNEDAGPAWKFVVGRGLPALLPTLAAMKDADAAAANWLATAADAIAAAEKTAGRTLPAEALTAFVKDAAQSPAARRIAFELVKGPLGADAAGRLLSGFIDDPSLESAPRRHRTRARLRPGRPFPPSRSSSTPPATPTR